MSCNVRPPIDRTHVLRQKPQRNTSLLPSLFLRLPRGRIGYLRRLKHSPELNTVVPRNLARCSNCLRSRIENQTTSNFYLYSPFQKHNCREPPNPIQAYNNMPFFIGGTSSCNQLASAWRHSTFACCPRRSKNWNRPWLAESN